MGFWGIGLGYSPGTKIILEGQEVSRVSVKVGQ